MSANLAAGCDQAVSLAQHGNKTPRCALILTATVLASSLAFLDGSVVNIALPQIGERFGGSASVLQWLVTGYLIPLSALQLLAGALGDHSGRRRVLTIGTALFTFASVLCAITTSVHGLLASRVLQGIGAALLLPNSLAVLGSSFNGNERGTAVGTWTAAGAIASAIGPPVAGWLVDEASWRWVFLLNVPLGLGALYLIRKVVPESSNDELPLDVSGTLIATLGLFALTFAVTQWSIGALDLASYLYAAGAAACFSLLVLVEARKGKRAMIPLEMFTSRAFVCLNLFTFLIYGAFGGLFVLLPYILMSVSGYSATAAGSAILPLPIVLGLFSRRAGRMSSLYGWCISLAAGAFISGIGYALLMNVAGSNYWQGVFPAVILIALGMAVVIAPLTTAVLSSVPDSHTATAVGFNSAVSRAGTLIAIAASGQVMTGTGANKLAAFHVAALVAVLLALAAAAIALTATGPLKKAKERGSTRLSRHALG